MIIFVANILIFWSVELAGNTSTVFLDNIVLIWRITTRTIKETSHNMRNIRKAGILYSKHSTINVAFNNANPQIKICKTKTRTGVNISRCFV